MKQLLFAISLLLMAFYSFADTAKPHRIAMLISGHGNEDPALSYDLEELAQSYLILSRNGVKIDIVTPEGGAVLVKSNKDHLDFIKDFKQGTPALAKLGNTLSATQAAQNSYQGLFIVGGDGAMIDLPVHADTQTFVQGIISKDLPTAAVCHGPAALVNLKDEAGNFFVKGKTINAFTLREEHAFSKENLHHFPFMLQTELEKRGANFQSNAPMLPFIAVDGNLITAQNPMSVPKAAEALLVKMGIQPKAREAFKDEATLALLSRARSEGSYLIDLALVKDPEAYDMNYMALYGFYAFGLAQTEASKAIELEIMARIGQHFSHPQYQLGLIAAYLEQGHSQKAKFEHELLLQQFPETQIPEQLLAKLTQ